jgi:hypothetical protein
MHRESVLPLEVEIGGERRTVLLCEPCRTRPDRWLTFRPLAPPADLAPTKLAGRG